MFAEKLSLQQVCDLLFPWHIEYWFSNDKYRIHGKADFVYKGDTDGKSLVIVDVKSHYSRISGYMHREEHKQQMICYAILAEWEFKIPVNKCRIFYSQDLTYEDFAIDDTDKAKLIEIRNQRKELLATPIPPRLTDDDAYKCRHCFHSEFCEQVADNGDTAVYSPIGEAA